MQGTYIVTMNPAFINVAATFLLFQNLVEYGVLQDRRPESELGTAAIPTCFHNWCSVVLDAMHTFSLKK